MIGYIFDILKNKKENPNSNTKISNNNEEQDKEIQLEDSLPKTEEPNIKSIESIKEEDSKKKKRKRKKKWIKGRKVRYRGPLFLISLICLIGFLISKLMLLNSDTEYILNAKINYIHSAKVYEVNYDIETMYNLNSLNIGEAVCTPFYYTSADTAIKKSDLPCIKGKVISRDKDKVNIKYEKLPKYITMEDFFIYLDNTRIEPNTIINNVNIKMKYFMGNYQVISIYP